ncbi:lytic polysaccharide monooxygenase [Trichoderma citrinoviride]|uniref:Lytic polysaccharide monooxygenase n=1 Tax=Trichoderma citrinoviride TaxID=58853 RepID=A0A2T4BJ23_9HYPO|nr:lytic polysaccharide monooxygenase [Trichoderma citrinoviride]PTB69317.1 lytic polysaccharide monooxygenase [Trichoderma citrinoviride]
MFSKLFTITALATAASAHVKMSNPVPYGASTLDNSPLDATGLNFPCKVGSGFPATYNLEGASNVYAQGSTQQLAFIGSAVHGGGSCQVSVTTDAQPDKNSVWKVIKSIEGGCPAQDQVGNMGDDAAAIDPYKYNFTIPKELEAGNYTLAWTWFNKVGNREMYMNCAPLTVTGSGGSADFLNTLPDMFVANIFGDEKCNTQNDKDLEFPQPGTDVVKMNGATEAFAPATFTQFCPVGFGSTASVPAATAAPQPTSAEAQPSSVAGGAPAPTPSAAPAPATPSSGSGSGSSGAFAAGTACSSEGQWNCIGGSQFQRCASGAWSAVQPLAAGTQCEAGQADNLKMVTKRGKRSMRRAKRS